MSSAARPRKSKAGKRKKKKDPNAPKRPRSAYILYCAEKRNDAKADHPDAKPAELMKILGDLWNQLSPTKKAEYNEKAKQDKDRYTDQLKSYHPPDDEDDDDDGGKRSKNKRGKKKKDPNEPKRAPSAYLIYGQKVRDQIKSEFPDLKSSEIMQKIGERWQKLTEEEKKPYNEEAAIAKAQYESKKAEYIAKKDDHRAPATVEHDEDEDAGDMGAGDDDDDDDGGDDDDEE
jgi:arsenate reductase-like glutaredoxin family protein